MKSTSATRKPYNGSKRALVIALDVGTTFSGVSYAILEPGDIPKIHGVTRFPGQEHVAGNSKIPSIMWYSKGGRMKKAGAEAESSSVIATAEDEGWLKTELFKLRLRPRSMMLKMNGMRLSPLPRGKTAVEVFGDFLCYLFKCTKTFIEDTHANGLALWKAVEDDIQFVLSHPNGWEGAQQTKMRRAAVYGGLIPNTDEGKARIRFVTEGEASLHACVLNGLAADVLSNHSGHGFLVADAGGGTLDISSYAIRSTQPLVIEEIAPPDCIFAGAVFVSRRARALFEEKLRSSKYGSPDSLDHITRRFDETTKRLFRDKKELQFVPFGSPLDKDLSVGIRGGQLKLTGAEVAELFDPSIIAAVASIQAQIEASAGAIKSVWLVGGFAASPWLFSQLQERLAPLNITVSRPDSQTSKAVADGAVGFYCDHHVSARMSKYMYGVEYLRDLDPQDQEHVARLSRLCELPSGPKLLPDAFDCILARGIKVKESTVFNRKYCTEISSLESLSVFEVEIWCYRAGDTIPKWIIRDAEEFSTLCVVRADLSQLKDSAEREVGPNGKAYWRIVFRIEIQFGLTEFQARLKWVHDGKVEYGPASIVYNEGGHRGRSDVDGYESTAEDESVASLSRDRSKARSDAKSQTSDAPLPKAEPIPVEVSPLAAPVEQAKAKSRSTSAGRSDAEGKSSRARSLSTKSGHSSQLASTLNQVWGAVKTFTGSSSPQTEPMKVDTPSKVDSPSSSPKDPQTKAPQTPTITAPELPETQTTHGATSPTPAVEPVISTPEQPTVSAVSDVPDSSVTVSENTKPSEAPTEVTGDTPKEGKKEGKKAGRKSGKATPKAGSSGAATASATPGVPPTALPATSEATPTLEVPASSTPTLDVAKVETSAESASNTDGKEGDPSKPATDITSDVSTSVPNPDASPQTEQITNTPGKTPALTPSPLPENLTQSEATTEAVDDVSSKVAAVKTPAPSSVALPIEPVQGENSVANGNDTSNAGNTTPTATAKSPAVTPDTLPADPSAATSPASGGDAATPPTITPAPPTVSLSTIPADTPTAVPEVAKTPEAEATPTAVETIVTSSETTISTHLNSENSTSPAAEQPASTLENNSEVPPGSSLVVQTVGLPSFGSPEIWMPQPSTSPREQSPDDGLDLLGLLQSHPPSQPLSPSGTESKTVVEVAGGEQGPDSAAANASSTPKAGSSGTTTPNGLKKGKKNGQKGKDGSSKDKGEGTKPESAKGKGKSATVEDEPESEMGFGLGLGGGWESL